MTTKTYSVALQRQDNIWVTNWGQFFKLDDINWEDVEQFAKDHGHKAYGYYYGTNSRNLTSARCRTVLKEFPLDQYKGMINYIFTIKHDNGTIKIKTSAKDIKSAKNNIMQFENCPLSALDNWVIA